MDIVAKEITCPKTEDHIHRVKGTVFSRKLLVVADDHISVYCREHGWLKIQLKSNGQNISFENPSAVISAHGPNTNFKLSPIPVVGLGKFALKRKRNAELSKI